MWPLSSKQKPWLLDESEIGLLSDAPVAERSHPPIVIEDAPEMTAASSYQRSPSVFNWHDGDKFAGSFGATQLLTLDYWTLRMRSAQLYRTSTHARGIVRRLVTNVINTGLHLECTPEESVLGLPLDSLADWSEETESRFSLWANTPQLCDRSGLLMFGQLQARAYEEALIDGDVLVVLEQNRRTRLPAVRLISGNAVCSPQKNTTGNRIDHGVERDAFGRHIAFWVRQDDGTIKRMPAFGEKTGRQLAWLVYGAGKRVDEVRGEPLLSIALGPLRDVDRYKDATLRKAVLASLWVAFIEKDADTRPSKFVSRSGAGTTTVQNTDNGGISRSLTQVNNMPGTWGVDLQHGEKVKLNGSQGIDEKFSDFEAAIIHSISWGLEIPPEILTLSFGSNYSASQAAIKEFKMFLDRVRMDFGVPFCSPVYQDWLISEVINGKIKADGLLDAFRNSGTQYDKLAAWVASDWAGHVKPSTDVLKEARGYGELLDRGLITYSRATREVTGMKFSKVARQAGREKQMLRDYGVIDPEPVPVETAPTNSQSQGAASIHVLRAIESSLGDLSDAVEEGFAK